MGAEQKEKWLLLHAVLFNKKTWGNAHHWCALQHIPVAGYGKTVMVGRDEGRTGQVRRVVSVVVWWRQVC